MTTAQLVRVETMTAVEIFKPGAIDPILNQIKEESRQQASKLDISRESDRKELASLAYKIARSKTFIDGQRKALVADEKKRLASIDAEGRRIWDELESLQSEIRKPLTDWENAEKQRSEAHEGALREIEGAGTFSLQNWQTLPTEAMRDRLREVEGDSRDWQEFGQRAAGVKAAAVAQIKDAIAKREKHDAEQAELARLRAEAAERERKEREERIAREAREKAEREAKEREESAARAAKAEQERIEREAREREARIQRDKEDAERREREAKEAAARAEQRAKEAAEFAAQREREKIERERLAAEEEQRKREANKKHRAKIETEAANSLISLGFAPTQVDALMAAIVAGKVSHVSIQY